MRAMTMGLGLAALAMGGCLGSDQPCSARPTDPACATIDGGGGDGGLPTDGGGTDAPAVDAHVPCRGMCSGTTPRCLVAGGNETCVGCLAESDCGTMHCDSAGTHACVECLQQLDCTSPTMSRCDLPAHACNACTVDADCTHLTSTPVCDATSGTCVACTTNAQCDAAHGCDGATHTCVAVTPMSALACGACLRDSECQLGQLCVPTRYGTTPVGTFCLWRQDATGAGTPNGNCATVAPYVNAIASTSVDGVAATVCELALSSCPALNDFRTGGRDASGQCAGPVTGTAADSDCGASMGTTDVPDGFCRADASSNHYCTLECTTTLDCPCRGLACTTHYACSGSLCALN